MIGAALVSLQGCGGCFGGKRDSATADSVITIQKDTTPVRDSSGVFRTNPGTTGRDTSAPPIPDVVFPNPASILVADSAAGQRIYRRGASCIACHGARADGVAGLGSNIVDREWTRGDGSLTFLYSVIRDGIVDANGRSLMPGSQLSPREMFQAAAYVYALSNRGVTVSDSSSLPPGAPPIAKPPPEEE
jgi:mono/diheme cytochrome c family protein